MWVPFVRVSRRRRREVSWGRRPVEVCEVGRMEEMRMGVPVRVLRTRRRGRWWWPVSLSGGCWEPVAMLGGS